MPAFYDSAAVEHLLDPPGCIAAVRDAMAAFSRTAVPQPLREIVALAPEKLFAVMPGMLAAPDGFGAKIISAYGDPARPGRSRHRGMVLLFDYDSGEIVAAGDAGAITEIRTAAASAVATDALAATDARSLGIFGTGTLARTHLLALPHVRPIERVVIWGRDPAAAQALAAWAATETGLTVIATDDPRDAARCDIVCTVTGSPQPVLLGEWVRPGTHVNIVGSSHAGPVEIDSALVVKSRYVADSRRSALAAAAEFLNAKAAGLIGDDHIVGEIGEVLNGTIAGRTDGNTITLYKSLGHVVQDLAALGYVHRKAIAA